MILWIKFLDFLISLVQSHSLCETNVKALGEGHEKSLAGTVFWTFGGQTALFHFGFLLFWNFEYAICG